MSSHEAGVLHATPAPVWLPTPGDVNELLPQLWSQGVRRDEAGVLTVAGASVTELAEAYGTPAFVLDEADLRARARAFRAAFAEAFAAVGIEARVFYAGKAFLSSQVARWIDQEGLGLDTCSLGEMLIAERAGFPFDRIGLHGNNKSVAELRFALERGAHRVYLDSFDEIERVARIAAELGVVAPVSVRVTAGVEAHTHEFIATSHEDQKFGFSLASGDALEALRRAAAAPELNLVGLHSHIGSQIFDTAGFRLAAERLLGLVAEARDAAGIELRDLDLGGGFGIAYSSQDTPREPAELAGQLAGIVDRVSRELGVTIDRVAFEPGRAIVGPSTFTLYEVGTIKRVALDAGVRTYVSVDGGMSDNIRTALYGADYSATLASRRSAAAPAVSRVVGLHCESGDVIVRDEYLPDDVTAGDLIAVPGTGAYCSSLSSNYNAVPRPPVVAVADGEARLIVRRETYDDLLARDVAPD